jgi:hypothetical protein
MSAHPLTIERALAAEARRNAQPDQGFIEAIAAIGVIGICARPIILRPSINRFLNSSAIVRPATFAPARRRI